VVSLYEKGNIKHEITESDVYYYARLGLMPFFHAFTSAEALGHIKSLFLKFVLVPLQVLMHARKCNYIKSVGILYIKHYVYILVQ
jgi:hypothetical protein